MWHCQVQEEYLAGMSAWLGSSYATVPFLCAAVVAVYLFRRNMTGDREAQSGDSLRLESAAGVNGQALSKEGEAAAAILRKRWPKLTWIGSSTHILLVFDCFEFQYSAKRIHTRDWK